MMAAVHVAVKTRQKTKKGKLQANALPKHPRLQPKVAKESTRYLP